jgi:hypothetical protein
MHILHGSKFKIWTIWDIVFTEALRKPEYLRRLGWFWKFFLSKTIILNLPQNKVHTKHLLIWLSHRYHGLCILCWTAIKIQRHRTGLPLWKSLMFSRPDKWISFVTWFNFFWATFSSSCSIPHLRWL